MSTSADGSSRRIRKCSACGKKFKFVSNLKNHLLIHIRDLRRPHQCKTCGKSFGGERILKVHERTHTGETLYRYSCGKCEKSFSTMYYLKIHNCIHTGEKLYRYSCGKCEKSFSTMYYLKIHNCIHTGEKPYTCGKCGKLYSDMGSFREHNCSTYKVNELYSCDKCDNSFESKNILDEHYHTHTIPTSHTDNTYTNSVISQEYFSDDDQEPEVKVELEYPEDVSDPLSIKEEIIKDEI